MRGDEITAARLSHGHSPGRVLPQCAHHVSTSDDTNELLLLIHKQRALPLTDGRAFVADQVRQFSELHGGGNAGHVSFHHVADSGQLEWINTIFASDVISAAGKSLGQDGASHEQDSDAE